MIKLSILAFYLDQLRHLGLMAPPLLRQGLSHWDRGKTGY